MCCYTQYNTYSDRTSISDGLGQLVAPESMLRVNAQLVAYEQSKCFCDCFCLFLIFLWRNLFLGWQMDNIEQICFVLTTSFIFRSTWMDRSFHVVANSHILLFIIAMRMFTSLEQTPCEDFRDSRYLKFCTFSTKS